MFKYIYNKNSNNFRANNSFYYYNTTIIYVNKYNLWKLYFNISLTNIEKHYLMRLIETYPIN